MYEKIMLVCVLGMVGRR